MIRFTDLVKNHNRLLGHFVLTAFLFIAALSDSKDGK